ncbi:hypothetical protein TIFTF001_054723 [Ficus carica]|uniref:Uncharacterized protein n=1 Tax=Ficus carica TaxID=3494 RepID=A0AA88EEA7_FICCA|nr:hypothetical protein TIFTF001_054723 [Ficus carica]
MEQEEELLRKQKRLGPATPTVAAVPASVERIKDWESLIWLEWHGSSIGRFADPERIVPKRVVASVEPADSGDSVDEAVNEERHG